MLARTPPPLVDRLCKLLPLDGGLLGSNFCRMSFWAFPIASKLMPGDENILLPVTGYE